MTIIDVTRFSRYLGRIYSCNCHLYLYLYSHSSNIFHLFLCAYHMCIYHSLGLDYPYTTIPSRCVVESILIHPKLIVVYCRVLIRVESCRRPLLLMHAIFCCCNLIRIYHISNAHKLSNTIGDIVYHIDFIIVGFVAVLHIIRLLQ